MLTALGTHRSLPDSASQLIAFFPVRVATESSCPEAAQAGAFPVRRWSRGGDYFGLAAGADGRFHVLWPDARSGAFEMWTAAVSIAAGAR